MPATAAAPATTSAGFISPAALLKHWQGHRRLTRRIPDSARKPMAELLHQERW